MADDAPTLVLLHGLGATAGVWDPVSRLAAERWPGPVLVPDLGGHGGAAWQAPYSFGRHADEVARAVTGDEPPAGTGGRRAVVVGHSMGGVVALALASGWFGVEVPVVVGLGIKLRWSEEELLGARRLASRPVRGFAAAEDALARYLKVSGLLEVLGDDVALDDPRVARGVLEDVVEDAAGGMAGGASGDGRDGPWRLAQDPATFAVGAPDVDGLLAAARARVVLAAGEHDPMCPPDVLHAVAPDGVVLAGLGHNAHVEDPAAVWDLIETATGGR